MHGEAAKSSSLQRRQEAFNFFKFPCHSQVDLIDMRSQRKKDVYGQVQQWIMTVKDHSTGLIYLCAIPKKKASFVAYMLER